MSLQQDMQRAEERQASEKARHGMIVVTAAGVFALVLLGVFLLERVLDDATSLHTWLQMLAGSTWPSGWDAESRRRLFSFAAGVAWHLTLNLAPAIGVAWIFWVLLDQRRGEHMQLRHLLRLRDESIKGRVSKALKQLDLPDEQRRTVETAVDRAYVAGARYWDGNQLPTLVGVRGARKFWKQPVEGE
jgi:hypothetical protein